MTRVLRRPPPRRAPRPSPGDISPLRNRHAGEVATVIGRGPSLLTLRASDIGPGPVITLNHAILEVRKLHLPNLIYTQQKDRGVVAPQPPETLILSAAQSHAAFPSYSPRYVIDVRRWFGITPRAMSTTMAVALARWMGCSRVRMLACDAVTVEDFRTVVNGEPLDKRGFGYLFAGRQATAHAQRIGMPLEWVAP